MIILVAVTLNIALGENGLIAKAKETRTKQEEQTIYEDIQGMMELNNNGEINVEKTFGNVVEKYTPEKVTPNTIAEGAESIEFTVQGKYGTYKYKITKNEIIIEKKTIPKLPEGLTMGSEFEMDADNDGTKEKWIVLYDGTASHLNENEIEVISKNTMGENLLLGENDTEAIKNATDINKNGTIENIERAIYSYNNAIDRINNYCKDLIKIENLGVRSVGSLPSNPNYKNTDLYKIRYLDKWPDKTAWTTYGAYGEDADTNMNTDCNQMEILGINAIESSNEYWLPSRLVSETLYGDSDGTVRFFICYMNSRNNVGVGNAVEISSNGSTHIDTNTAYAVRPIIKLKYV